MRVFYSRFFFYIHIVKTISEALRNKNMVSDNLRKLVMIKSFLRLCTRKKKWVYIVLEKSRGLKFYYIAPQPPIDRAFSISVDCSRQLRITSPRVIPLTIAALYTYFQSMSRRILISSTHDNVLFVNTTKNQQSTTTVACCKKAIRVPENFLCRYRANRLLFVYVFVVFLENGL